MTYVSTRYLPLWILTTSQGATSYRVWVSCGTYRASMRASISRARWRIGMARRPVRVRPPMAMLDAAGCARCRSSRYLAADYGLNSIQRAPCEEGPWRDRPPPALRAVPAAYPRTHPVRTVTLQRVCQCVVNILIFGHRKYTRQNIASCRQSGVRGWASRTHPLSAWALDGRRTPYLARHAISPRWPLSEQLLPLPLQPARPLYLSNTPSSPPRQPARSAPQSRCPSRPAAAVACSWAACARSRQRARSRWSPSSRSSP